MFSRASLRITTTLLVFAVLLRAFPFVWWPGAHFDSDQAIVGLMAKHISEGRAWPLFYYGQNYMLAVEAYLAAPLMLVMGATVTALKLPLVVVNLAVVVLLLRLLTRDAKLSAPVASIAVLPIALPAAGIAARSTEAMGGNVEPWLYVLLLWWLRERPFAFGSLLAIGMLHREFTAYGAMALLLMDALGIVGRFDWQTRATTRLRHWALIGVAFVATRAIALSLQPFASGLGPGTRGDEPALTAGAMESLGGRMCFAPDTWGTRATQLVTDHLPRIVGGTGASLRDYGVLSGVYSGHPGLGLWVAGITAAGLGAGAWHWWSRRRTAGDGETSHLGGYLVLVGVVSTLVYGFATCSSIRVETMRYNLLGVWVPVGALVMALQSWRQPVARAAFGAAVGLWCLLNALDVVSLTEEYLVRRPVDQRQAVADALERRGVRVAWSAFRNAYHITFLAQERVRVAANDFSRIHAYADEAARSLAPTIADGPCAGGEPLPSGQYLCPSVRIDAFAR